MKLSLNITTFTALKMTAVVALLSLASVEPLAAFGQQAQSHPAQAAAAPVAAQKTVAATEEEESAPTPNKPGHEGIKVHGAWVIDVHNADGSLAEHRAFHNSLATDNGENMLFYLLSGRLTPSSLGIAGYNGQVLQSGTLAVDDGFFLVPANTNTADRCNTTYSCTPSETVTVTPATYTNQVVHGKIVLQGQVAPATGLTINYVQTFLVGCHQTNYVGQETLSPAACAAATPATLTGQQTDYLAFTATSIPDVVVAAGQYVIISVTITFS